jgi:6-phosphogluconolactonase/glucosamine-6-phosphate isomerase/deaminase
MSTSNGVNANFEVLRQADKQSATAEAGEYLNQALIEHKKTPVLLMLSAGSALAILDYVGINALGENLTVCMLDDRFSQDKDVNNFLQLQKTDFYKDALDAEASFFGTLPRSDEGMQDVAARLEKNLLTWREENPAGLIFATLGMGPDGHTAGIFPFDDPETFDKLFNTPPWTVAYDVGSKHQYNERITTTISFLKTIDLAFALVCGKEKKERLDFVIANKGAAHNIPALAWHEIKDVKIFTDLE